ncbi:MAG: putative aminoglycoside phosphotransferase [Mycobacterium sp.]|nr:putative aminoglycoside phosphotransferase [Mycobacterium sp.]
MTSPSRTRLAADELPTALEPIVRSHIPGAAHATIANWAPTERGFSTETFLFDVTGIDGDQSSLGLVFRRPPEFAILPDYDLRRQFLTMQRLEPSPIPVPRVRWIDPEPDALGTPYLIMDRIDGAVSVSDMPPYHQAGIYADTDDAGRATLWNECLDIVAAVHRLDPAEYRLGFLDLAAYGDTPPQRVATFLRYAITWATGDAPIKPTFARALDWLDVHLYDPERVTLCWGDARMSNVLYGPDHRAVAALDWEVAYLGDPEADLAWMFMTDWVSSPLVDRAPAPGTPSREETIERYQRLTGHRVRNMRFNDVTAALLLAVALIRLNGRLNLPDVDLAEICAQRVDLMLSGDSPR